MTRGSRSRPAVAWLQILLVGALACVVLILAEAYRAARSSRVVAERALKDYADFAAWSYRQHLSSRMREAVDELLGPVNHGEGMHTGRRIPSAHELGHYLEWTADCQCHRPRVGPLPADYLGFTLGSDTLEVGQNLAPPGSRGWLVDQTDGMAHTVPAMRYGREEVRWINSMLSETARRRPRSAWGYDVIVTRRDSLPRYFATRSMPTEWGDTIVYAVEYPSASVDSLFRDVLASVDLLPSSLVSGRSNHDVLELVVSDAAGHPLFGTPHSEDAELAAETQLPDTYGGLRVSAQLRPEMASALLIGGVPRSRVPLLLLILALAAGLSVLAAVQLRREVRFAAERATFVANVSHELRTPLTQVRLVLDTLRLGRVGDAQSRDHALGIADREVLRLQHLVEGVLRFTRGPRPGEVPAVRGDVAAEARTVAREFQPLAEPRGVHLEVVAEGAVDASLQAGALRQVLLNLLDNAVKYGKDHSTVRVEVRSRETGGVQLTVSDEGAGVPAADRERIWRPFERGRTSRQRPAGGSGIGLTIVREIADEHGGSARVEDAPGGGARFVVDLPNVEG